MLFDRVLGNVDDPPGEIARDPAHAVELSWADCNRRAVRARTNRGVDVGILPPLGTTLRHGDVLGTSSSTTHTAADAQLLVHVRPCEVWVATFPDVPSLASAALELGNLHVPAQVTAASELITLPDGPALGVFSRYAVAWRAETRRFVPLRATVLGAEVKLARTFQIHRGQPLPAEAGQAGESGEGTSFARSGATQLAGAQLTNNRE
jgi:urease accessory protein UreE